MYIVSLNYVKPMEVVEEHLAAHVAYLGRQYAAGHFIASGRKVPRTGGMILVRPMSRGQLEAVLAEDPFRINGVAEYEVTEFVPTLTAPGLEQLKEG